MNITEDYVSLETAKLLREKGFDEICDFEYGVPDVDKGYVLQKFYKPIKNSELIDTAYTAPTLQMAMKWILYIKHYFIQIMLDSWALGNHLGYYVVIQDVNSDFEEVSPCFDDDPEKVFFDTYEEALQSAIKYTLEKLI